MIAFAFAFGVWLGVALTYLRYDKLVGRLDTEIKYLAELVKENK